MFDGLDLERLREVPVKFQRFDYFLRETPKDVVS
jgi:hypothetical protein